MSANSLVTSGTPHPSDLASLTKPFADQTDQACPFAMVSMPLSSAANFSRVQSMNALNLFAVKLFVSAVSSQVTCLRDVVIDPFAKNVEDVTTPYHMA